MILLKSVMGKGFSFLIANLLLSLTLRADYPIAVISYQSQ